MCHRSYRSVEFGVLEQRKLTKSWWEKVVLRRLIFSQMQCVEYRKWLLAITKDLALHDNLGHQSQTVQCAVAPRGVQCRVPAPRPSLTQDPTPSVQVTGPGRNAWPCWASQSHQVLSLGIWIETFPINIWRKTKTLSSGTGHVYVLGGDCQGWIFSLKLHILQRGKNVGNN